MLIHRFLHEKIHPRAAGLEVNDCMASASADGAMPEDMDTASDPNGEEPKSDDSSDSSSSSSDSDSYDDAEQRRLAYVLRLTLGISITINNINHVL